MMKVLAFVLLLLLSVGVHGVDGKPPANEKEIEAVEEVQLEHVEIANGGGSGIFLGISKHRWMTISGPIIWIAMAGAIGTRYIRIKGKARQLSKTHKICGFTALGLGTVHGLFGLFL